MRSFTFYSRLVLALVACALLYACGYDPSNVASASVAGTPLQASVTANDCRSVDASSSQKGCRSQRTLVGRK